MARKRRARRLRRALGLLILLALFALLAPLNGFFAGLLPGGGRLPDPDQPPEETRDGGTLRVTVIEHESGEPVEGATILVHRPNGDSPRRATSDEGGEAQVEGIEERLVRVEADSGQGRGEAWAHLEVSEQVSLAIEPAGRRQGRVVHPDGRPAEALVLLVNADGEELDRTRTDERGQFEFPEHEEAVACIAESRLGELASSRTKTLVIEAGERIEGRLIGARPGFLEVYGLVPARDEDALLPIHARWRIDEQGRYEGSLPRGARAWGLCDGLPVVLDGEERALPERIDASGRVTRAGGGAPEEAELSFRADLDLAWDVRLPRRVVSVEGDGSFKAPGLARTRYRVEARAKGCATRVFQDVVPGPDPLRFELEPGFELAGSVVDTRGVPLADARVHAEGLPDPLHSRPGAWELTDARGGFRLRGLGGDHARLRITATGFFATTLERVAATDSLRVVLQAR